jgi:fumarate reductase subunit D
MRTPGPDRVNALLWATFAQCAVITALIVPAHILVQGVLAPLGIVPAFDQHYASFAAALSNPLVKIYLLVLFATVFYTFGHRVRYLMTDLAHGYKPLFGAVGYGLAVIGIAATAYVLFTVP